jgi:hypothetical protein
VPAWCPLAGLIRSLSASGARDPSQFCRLRSQPQTDTGCVPQRFGWRSVRRELRRADRARRARLLDELATVRRLQRALTAALVVVVVVGFGGASPVKPGPTTAPIYRVDHVVDGDAIALRNGQRVRLVQIDTPEVFARSRHASRSALPGTTPPRPGERTASSRPRCVLRAPCERGAKPAAPMPPAASCPRGCTCHRRGQSGLRPSSSHHEERHCFKGLFQWAHLGSNQGPPACEAGALPLSYAPGRKPRRLEGMLSAAASRP